MKPVKQTVFGYPKGNCFAACVASIMEIPLEDTPELSDIERFDIVWRKWFRAHGLGIADIPAGTGEYLEGYVIATGDSPRGDVTISGNPVQHAVVCKDMELVFDPHPDDTFIVGSPKYFTIIYPLSLVLPTRRIKSLLEVLAGCED